MNEEEKRHCIKVFSGWAFEGKQVQSLNGHSTWLDINPTGSDWRSMTTKHSKDYRLKPEPETLEIHVYKNDGVYGVDIFGPTEVKTPEGTIKRHPDYSDDIWGESFVHTIEEVSEDV